MIKALQKKKKLGTISWLILLKESICLIFRVIKALMYFKVNHQGKIWFQNYRDRMKIVLLRCRMAKNMISLFISQLLDPKLLMGEFLIKKLSCTRLIPDLHQLLVVFPLLHILMVNKDNFFIVDTLLTKYRKIAHSLKHVFCFCMEIYLVEIN